MKIVDDRSVAEISVEFRSLNPGAVFFTYSPAVSERHLCMKVKGSTAGFMAVRLDSQVSPNLVSFSQEEKCFPVSVELHIIEGK